MGRKVKNVTVLTHIELEARGVRSERIAKLSPFFVRNVCANKPQQQQYHQHHHHHQQQQQQHAAAATATTQQRRVSRSKTS